LLVAAVVENALAVIWTVHTLRHTTWQYLGALHILVCARLDLATLEECHQAYLLLAGIPARLTSEIPPVGKVEVECQPSSRAILEAVGQMVTISGNGFDIAVTVDLLEFADRATLVRLC
jgi:hypothetical protein